MTTEPPRTEPGRLADERASLDDWLDYYRATLLHKCADLTPRQLAARSCSPSPMSLAGLVRHMTEMERIYAHRLADPDVGMLYCTEQSPDGDFLDASEATAPPASKAAQSEESPRRFSRAIRTRALVMTTRSSVATHTSILAATAPSASDRR